jgi:hypothetical protein
MADYFDWPSRLRMGPCARLWQGRWRLGWVERSYDYQCGDGYLDYPFYQQQQFRLDVGCVEWAFWNNWSARLEYDYIGLNSQTFTVPAPGFAGLPAGDQFTSHNRDVQMVNLGINYKFGY